MNKMKKLFIGFVISFSFLIIINVKTKAETKNYTVVIDAGHGGYDGGARGSNSIEKEINLQIALKLRNYLQKIGVNVIMIRESDESFNTNRRTTKKQSDLNYRLEIINESKADLYLSVHMNAMKDGRWRGAQTFYYGKNEENKRMAETIQKSLKSILQSTTREAKTINSLYLLKNAQIPGVLIECGFLSNYEEEQLLLSSAYQDKVAYAIYLGLLEYWN